MPTMNVLVKLKLPPELQSFHLVKRLQGLSDLEMDEDFGLVLVDPLRQIFVVRVRKIDRVEERKKQCPHLIQAYGDERIESIEKKQDEKGVNNG